ncbi:MAG: TIGR01212 family radical SAM protein [Thermodesulfobacteriota bacterium]
MNRPYNTLSSYLREKFGARVFKVTIDGGFTCPNRDGTKGYGGCVYCAPGALTPRGFTPGLEVTEQLERGIVRVKKRHRAEKFIAYFQINTNTHAPLDYLKDMYGEVLGRADVAGLAVSTRPDSLDEGVLSLLSEMKEQKPLWVELGLQSGNERTLEAINRKHSAADFEDAVIRAHKRGIDICAHVILGLPGEGRTEILKTIGLLSRLKVWGIKFHQLQVLRGAPLEKLYRRGGVKTLGLEEYVRLVIECLEALPPAVVVHRLFGDAPGDFLLAPRWGLNKFVLLERILERMAEMGTRQGARMRATGG